MAREQKLGNQKRAKETPANKHMESIVEDVIEATAMSYAQWRALTPNPFLPLAIPLSQGGHYPVTQVGVDAAHALTRQTWTSREDLRQTINIDAFTKLSFQAIGDTLRECRLRLPDVAGDKDPGNVVLGDEFYSALVDDYRTTLQQLSSSAKADLDWHIPCHLFYAQSQVKGSVLVGLAIDAIGLRFHVEDARRFNKAGKQHLFAEDRLATTLDGRILRGSIVQMPGVGGRPGAQVAKMPNEQTFLDAAGCILQHYVDGRRSGHALHLVERWANALYWTGEARREVSDFMAVVKYGCAADGLSGAGGNANDVTAFAKAALRPSEAMQDGRLTVDAAVHKVYREGRNKLAHGEMPGLLEDHAEPRAIGEALLSALFDVVTPVLADLLQNEPNLVKLNEKHAYRLIVAKLSAKGTSPA